MVSFVNISNFWPAKLVSFLRSGAHSVPSVCVDTTIHAVCHGFSWQDGSATVCKSHIRTV